MNKDLIIFDGKTLNIMSDRVTSRGLNKYLNSSDSILMEEIYKLKKELSRLRLEFLNRKRILSVNVLKYIIKFKYKNIVVKIANSKTVYINGEGAIHHDRLTSLILITLGLIAKENGKKVILINFTIESMSEKYLKLLNQFDAIIPREKKSYLYLKPYINDEKLFQSYDFAWYYLYTDYRKYMLAWNNNEINTNKILFTKGVSLENIEEFTKYDYLVLDEGDKKFEAKFEKSIDVESLENTETKDISKFLDILLGYEFLISGRHHTNIVAMYLGLPTLGLKSNTSKVSSTMHDMLELKYKDNIAYSDINFVDFMNQKIIEDIIENFEQLKLKLENII
jgi:polysaccharide pyruvyl transferase WcaK-like protein